jgi:hypothetical protein
VVPRAHLVLYLADEEWNAWQDSTRAAGLRTVSQMISDALKLFF